MVLVEPAPSTSLAKAVEDAERYRHYTKAEATQKGYRQDWKRFCVWAREKGAAPLPADPATIVGHLGWLADEGYSMASIDRFVASAAHFHAEHGLEFPRNRHVKETLKGIRRKLGSQQSKRTPLELGTLTMICDHLAATDASFRVRALLTVGWFALLRSDNLIAIKRAHVQFVPEGFILHLPSSKTDQEGVGRDVAVHAQENKTVCPVYLLQEYFRLSRFDPDELIFEMSKRTVSRLVKRVVADPSHGHNTMREIQACAACSEVARGFASHSLRRGAATSLAEAGISEHQLMEQGGWKNSRTARGYIDRANLFKNNPTKGLAKR